MDESLNESLDSFDKTNILPVKAYKFLNIKTLEELNNWSNYIEDKDICNSIAYKDDPEETGIGVFSFTERTYELNKNQFSTPRKNHKRIFSTKSKGAFNIWGKETSSIKYDKK